MDSSKFLLPDEIERLTAILTKFRGTNARDCLLIELALKSGARASELIKNRNANGKETGIRKQDLNPSFKTVHIRGLKGSSDRDIGLNPDLYARLEKYAQTVDDEFLFEISYQRLDQLWSMYRPVKKRFHALRHTFAVELYRKTKDVLLLKRALGHKNIRNTMVYTEIPISSEDFARMAL